jgi:ABC-type multidrug transport system ATPase subunit
VTAALRLQRVQKRFGSRDALRGLSFEVPEGSICGVIGPNGAGKTTCFAIVAGLLKPDSGEVDVLGRGAFRAELHSGSLALLPQDAELSPYMPARELLTHYAQLQGATARQARADADRVLSEVALSDRARARVSELSHGMRRRLQVAQALIGDPKLVMLDEPTSGLDPELVVRIRELLVAQRGKRTLLVSSHQLSELESICDHVVFIHEGRALRSGTLQEVTAERQLVRIQFEGSLSIELLHKELTGFTFQLHDQLLEVQAAGADSIGQASAAALRCLLDAGVDIVDVRRGRGLEHVYMRDLTSSPAPRNAV